MSIERITELNEKSSDVFDYIFSATFAHSAVHRDVIVQSDDYADGVLSRELLIVVPTGEFAHMDFAVTCTSDARVEFFRNTTTSADGTSLRTARLNLTSAKSTKVSTYHTPTITSDGTQLPGGFLAGGSGGNSQGGHMGIHNDAEWILPEGKYLVRITPSASATISTKFEWYE